MHDHPSEGGSYLINEQGERVRIEPPTQDHPDGNRARPADAGVRFSAVDELITDAEESASAKSAKPKRAK